MLTDKQIAALTNFEEQRSAIHLRAFNVMKDITRMSDAILKIRHTTREKAIMMAFELAQEKIDSLYKEFCKKNK